MSAPDLVEELWREQSLWSRTANRMKKRIERARLTALTATVTAAVLGAAAGLTITSPAAWAADASRVLAVLAGLGVGVLPLLRPYWSGERLRDWTRARSVSEALKSDVYLWLARAGEYRGDAQAARLRHETDKVRADGADLLRYRKGIVAEERPLPAVRDLTSYFAVRVTEQIDGYYRRRARELQRRLRWFRAWGITLGGVGVIVGTVVAAGASTSLAPWIAVITTISTALAVHVAADRYDFQLIEFLRTAERLDQLQRKAAATADSTELGALAAEAEEVISIENEGWMAKLAEDPAEQKAS
jgi:hypothetical protein